MASKKKKAARLTKRNPKTTPARTLARARSVYRTFAGRPWDDDAKLVTTRVKHIINEHAKRQRPARTTKAEAEARAIVEDLRKLQNRLETFVARCKEGGQCSRYLLAWRQQLGYEDNGGYKRPRYTDELDPRALAIVTDAAFPEQPPHAGFREERLTAFVGEMMLKNLTNTKRPTDAFVAAVWILAGQSDGQATKFDTVRDAVKAARQRLVLGIGSPFRVFGNRSERPGELLEDHENEVADSFSKRCAFPVATVVGHVEAPQVHGVAPHAEVLDGIVLGT